MGNCVAPTGMGRGSLSTEDQDRRARELELITNRDTAKSVVSQGSGGGGEQDGGGRLWYIVDRTWLNMWLNYTATGENGPRPGPINNSCLIMEAKEEEENKEGVQGEGRWKIKSWLVMDKEDEPGDYRVVKKEVWEAFLELYGGGPEIHVQGEMIEVDDISKWVFDMNFKMEGDGESLMSGSPGEGSLGGSRGASPAPDLTMSLLKKEVKPGDEVILFSPYFESYKVQVEGAGGVAKTVPMVYDQGRLHMNSEDFRSTLSPKTKVVILTSPQHSTGVVFTNDEMLLIASIVRGRKDITVHHDEVYNNVVERMSARASMAVMSSSVSVGLEDVSIDRLESIGISGNQFELLKTRTRQASFDSRSENSATDLSKVRGGIGRVLKSEGGGEKGRESDTGSTDTMSVGDDMAQVTKKREAPSPRLGRNISFESDSKGEEDSNSNVRTPSKDSVSSALSSLGKSMLNGLGDVGTVGSGVMARMDRTFGSKKDSTLDKRVSTVSARSKAESTEWLFDSDDEV